MPAKISMFISNGNPVMPQVRSIQTVNVPKAAVAPTSLSSPFIARISNATSGCGSCGRK